MKKKMCNFVLCVCLLVAAAVGYFAYNGLFGYLASWILIVRFIVAISVAVFVACMIFITLATLTCAAFDYP